jgi:hypothetical protein
LGTSGTFAKTGELSASSEFAESLQFSVERGSLAGAPAEQVSGGVSGAALGGGAAGGLAALAALALLLLLLKKKKKAIEELEETGESTAGTIDEDDAYISEYGLSDGVRPVDSDEDREDVPHEAMDDSGEDSGGEHMSEHNPDELDPDE